MLNKKVSDSLLKSCDTFVITIINGVDFAHEHSFYARHITQLILKLDFSVTAAKILARAHQGGGRSEQFGLQHDGCTGQRIDRCVREHAHPEAVPQVLDEELPKEKQFA